MSTNQATLPFLRTLHRLRGAFWRRRVIYWWVRALWVALLVPTVVMGGYLLWGWQVHWLVWLSLMLLVGVASFLWAMRPIPLEKMARRLDDLLGMRAQLVTALEVSQDTANPANRPENNPVTEQLVQDTVNVTVVMRRQVNTFGRSFWLEMQALIAVAALLGAMLLFDTLRPNIPQAPPADLPSAGQEPTADQVIPPDPNLQQQSPQQQELSDSQLRNILKILADALRDQAVTRAVAEAIDRDDLGGAADELRRLADRLEELSSNAHQELGNSLQEAADKIGGDAPDITDPLRRGKQALDINNMPGASRALDDLAEVLDNLNENSPQSSEAEAGNESEDAGESQEGEPQEAAQEEGGGGGGEGDGGSSNQPLDEEEERLPIDGQPLELESEEMEQRVLQASELDAEAGEETTEASPFTRQPLNAAGDELGPDPLTYPWEKRDVIRQYFSP